MTDAEQLAALTDHVNNLSARVEHLEQLDADNTCNTLTGLGPDFHNRHCPTCHA